MAVPFSNTKLRVPKGFQNILEGLAREVLRSQPDNIFEFGSKYFDQLLKIRDETGHDPAVHGARLEDRFYNNDSFKSPSVDPSSPGQQDAALTIQTNYRKHAAEQEVDKMKAEEAAERIQAGFRGYQDRQKFQEMKRDKDSSGTSSRSPEDKKSAEEDEVDIDLNDPEVEKAAVKIQAGFKGFKARQEVKDIKETKETDTSAGDTEKKKDEDVDIDLNDPEVENAALKIQAGFKGMKARQEVQAIKDKSSQSGEEKSTEETKDKPKEEEIDIDLNDPETEKAAIKIQAGFKGYKTRKGLKDDKSDGKSDDVEAKTEETAEDKQADGKKDETGKDDIDLNDPKMEEAATKIQAGFKGFKTRKELQGKKESGAGTAGEEEGENAEESKKEEGEGVTEETAQEEQKDDNAGTTEG